MMPQPQHNDQMAIGSLQKALTDPNSNINNELLSYSLYHVGEFDDDTGKFTTPEQPVLVITAKDAMTSMLKEQELIKKAKGEPVDEISNDS